MFHAKLLANNTCRQWFSSSSPQNHWNSNICQFSTWNQLIGKRQLIWMRKKYIRIAFAGCRLTIIAVMCFRGCRKSNYAKWCDKWCLKNAKGRKIHKINNRWASNVCYLLKTVCVQARRQKKIINLSKFGLLHKKWNFI